MTAFTGLPAFPAPHQIPAVSTYTPAADQDPAALPLLFTPLTIRGVTFKNRVGVSPMCMYSCVDGVINVWHVAHLSQYAIHGAGLVIIEATAVQPNGRISTHCPGLWNDDQIIAIKAIADFCHSQGAKVAIQLAHAGRAAGYYSPHVPDSQRLAPRIAPIEDGGWPDNIIAPSAIKAWETAADPREASLDDIAAVVAAFGSAARRSHDADLDVVEIHGAHGYLINEFLSPLSNKRTDHYGGSFENRIRILLEICQEVRKFWPEDKPLFVRLSCTDWAEGGWTSEDTVRLAKVLEAIGVDLIDCSSGGVVPITTDHPHLPGWNVPFSDDIKKSDSTVLTAAVGGITEPQHAESILQDGKADMILLGRAFLRDQMWVAKAAAALGVAVQVPVQYRRAGKAPSRT
ncbi:hypothetical protein HK105_202070 [Polyrhizophydium stewartii]|uniref:NADH:flavin oxidoreductase/NADH oxidase N-terminal domain-containing protein n=1 Tax=Polyrhizophydium stewartii TaxID=2732419 RepID=A0ABR4NF51_9FUNG